MNNPPVTYYGGSNYREPDDTQPGYKIPSYMEPVYAVTDHEEADTIHHRAAYGAAAITSTSTLNSGRVNPPTIIKVDAGGGVAT